MKKIGNQAETFLEWCFDSAFSIVKKLKSIFEYFKTMPLKINDLPKRMGPWVKPEDEGRGRVFFLSRLVSLGYLLFSISMFSVDKNIRLYIQDMEQNPIRQVEKGVPFLLQVVVDNMNGVQQPENIPGTEQFGVTRYGSSQSTNIINGLRTDRMIFNYALRAQDTGTFRLGPLSIRDKDGTMVTSESIQVVVGDTTISHSVKKQPYFLETQIDKKSLYVGQELAVKIRFYYANEFENLKIIDPKFDNFVVGDVSRDPVEGTETVRGVEYRYHEWTMQVYPEKTGSLLIPGVQAVFRVAADFHQSLMGIFDMFGMSSEKTVQSAARSVDVLPLPESKKYKNVSAVGKFDQATFSLKQKKGDVGEGIVATCTITGSGNFAMIKAPQLTLPAGLKYYESNSSVQKLGSGKQEKIFEYIIQAEQPGEFKISSQKFIYFDTEEKIYKILQTNGSVLQITGDASVVKNDDAKNDQSVVHDINAKSGQYVFKEGEIDYVLESGLTSALADSMMQKLLSWMILLLLVLSCIAVLYSLYNSYVDIAWHETYWGYYLLVRWQLCKVARKQDVVALYKLFQQVCNHYHIELQGQDLVDALKKVKVSDVKLQEWKQFVQTLLVVVFARQQDAVKDKQYILDQGQYWMKELLRVCRNLSRDSKKE